MATPRSARQVRSCTRRWPLRGPTSLLGAYAHSAAQRRARDLVCVCLSLDARAHDRCAVLLAGCLDGSTVTDKLRCKGAAPPLLRSQRPSFPRCRRRPLRPCQAAPAVEERQRSPGALRCRGACLARPHAPRHVGLPRTWPLSSTTLPAPTRFPCLPRRPSLCLPPRPW
jgi:hypothetical protein